MNGETEFINGPPGSEEAYTVGDVTLGILSSNPSFKGGEEVKEERVDIETIDGGDEFINVPPGLKEVDAAVNLSIKPSPNEGEEEKEERVDTETVNGGTEFINVPPMGDGINVISR